MQELMAAADVMITDYSGSMFEFMLTGRPVFLFAGDIARYLADERELYFTFEELPFSLAENKTQLRQNILEFDCEEYKAACMQFMELVGMEEDGEGARVLADRILEEIHKGADGFLDPPANPYFIDIRVWISGVALFQLQKPAG